MTNSLTLLADDQVAERHLVLGTEQCVSQLLHVLRLAVYVQHWAPFERVAGDAAIVILNPQYHALRCVVQMGVQNPSFNHPRHRESPRQSA